jgi:hypothetical protein
LHRPGEPCPLEATQPVGGRVAQPDNPEDTSWQLGGRKDADITSLDDARNKKTQPVPQGVAGQRVGSINMADLGTVLETLGSLKVLGGEASQSIDQAINQLSSIQRTLHQMTNQVQSQTLSEYAALMGQIISSLEAEQIRIAHGGELGDNYAAIIQG